MAKLPLMTAKELSKVLQKLGFELKRQQGSPCFLNIPMGEQPLSLIIPVKRLIEAL